MITEARLIDTANSVIQRMAGPNARAREDQIEAVRALLIENRRVLLVQKTGWGKSAVYWIATRLARDSGRGITVVISPLLALMRNQVESARAAGIRAVTLNSSNVDDWFDIESRIMNGEVDLILISPERLSNPRFQRVVFNKIKDSIGLLVIDEAHCISNWGHDFRPDYQRIALILAENPDTTVLCTTATANERVTLDIADQLGTGTKILRGELTRDSLHLSVVKGLKPVEHFSWVSDAMKTLSGSGIIYTLTVDKVTSLTNYLVDSGFKVRGYHGSTPAEEREEIEAQLLRNELKAVVATSALGMGYDKPDLAFCIHVGCPSTAIDYYQQVGRAGRNLNLAAVALLTDKASDERIWEWFATNNVPKAGECEAILESLENSDKPLTVVAVSSATGLSRSKTEVFLKILAVDGAVEYTEEGWVSTGHQWKYDASKYQKLINARRKDSQSMAEYARANWCLETQLRVALDDRVNKDDKCGRCSVCTGKLPFGLPDSPTMQSTKNASNFLKGSFQEIENRKQWPTGIEIPSLGPLKRSISPEHLMSPGRSLATYQDTVWGADVEEFIETGIPSSELVEGIQKLISSWFSPSISKPTMVVPVPSARKSPLVLRLAHVVSTELGVPLHDILKAEKYFQHDREKSAEHRARVIASNFSLISNTDLAGHRILLVDDYLRHRWTLTINAAILRHAGAASVTPFALYSAPAS